jgi:hypothetical protein
MKVTCLALATLLIASVAAIVTAAIPVPLLTMPLLPVGSNPEWIICSPMVLGVDPVSGDTEHMARRAVMAPDQRKKIRINAY